MRACILTLAVLFGAGWVVAAADMDDTSIISNKRAKKNVEQAKTLAATLFESDERRRSLRLSPRAQQTRQPGPMP